MPKRYEKIRDKFRSEGMSLAEAKTRAAKIENSLRTKEGKAGMKPDKRKPSLAKKG